MATQGATAKKHATKKPKAEKPKAEKPKAEKPAEETKKTSSDANGSAKQKTNTIWNVLLLGKKNKHGKYITDKKENLTTFHPATDEYLISLCEAQGLEPENDEELVKALDSLGL